MTLFYDIVGPAATGTGTARAAINSTYRVPSNARELIGIRPWMTLEAPATSDSVLGVWDIKGSDFRFQPCEGLMPVGAGKLGVLNEVRPTPIETWKIHAPLNGNETLNIGVEPLSAAGDNGQAGVTMIYSTVRTGKPVIYGKCSREVAGPTTVSTTTTGTNIRVDNGIKMHEIYGVATPGSNLPVASLEYAGRFTMRCTGWEGPQETTFFHSIVHGPGTGATSGLIISSIMRLPFDAPFKSKQATVNTSHFNYDVQTNAGVLAHGIRWLGT